MLAEVTRFVADENSTTALPRRVLHGWVRQVKPVGLGIVRERASIRIEFTHGETPDGKLVPLRASLVRVDNAREQVNKDGRIQGILAANNPLGVVRGIWYRPSAQLIFRAPGGLTGASGMAWSRLALGPAGALGLFGAKLVFMRLPDPEIDLPAGTEMILRVDVEADRNFWTETSIPEQSESEVATLLGRLPFEIQKPNGTSVPDIVNLALIGSEDLVRRAFFAAGWVEAEQLNRRSFGRAYKAFTQRSGYSEAPVSTLHYQERPPELVFQKSLNSIAKRHHVRLWRIEVDGAEVWLAAASHDISVTFDRKTFLLSHRIDSDLDAEREKVIGDLAFAESIASLNYTSRTVEPDADRRTDGGLAVAQMQEPVRQRPPQAEEGSKHKISLMRRAIRRVTLETRQYLFRENVYYLGYLSIRKVVDRHRAIAEAMQTKAAAADLDASF